MEEGEHSHWYLGRLISSICDECHGIFEEEFKESHSWEFIDTLCELLGFDHVCDEVKEDQRFWKYVVLWDELEPYGIRPDSDLEVVRDYVRSVGRTELQDVVATQRVNRLVRKTCSRCGVIRSKPGGARSFRCEACAYVGRWGC